MISETRRPSPVGAAALTDASHDGSLSKPQSMEALAKLGHWLEANTGLLTQGLTRSTGGAAADEVVDGLVAEVRRCSTQAVARWLITNDAAEARLVGKEIYRSYGSLAIEHGVAQNELVKDHLRWRDTVSAALAVAAHELNLDDRALTQAMAMTRRSFDVTLVRMCQQFELDRSGHRRRVETQGEDLARKSAFDALTSLPNRTTFHSRLRKLTRKANDGETSVVVMLINLNRFKVLNDTLGATCGDEFLRLVASRLYRAAQSQSHELLARLDGDEFGLLMEVDRSTVHPVLTARRILSGLDDSFSVGGVTCGLSARVGITIGPSGCCDADLLLAQADSAMDHAKRTGKSVATYESKYDTSRPLRHLALLDDLRKAPRYDEFVVHYQPKLDLGSGRIVGIEALVLWQHPQLGLLTADEFMPFAETSEILSGITTAVMDKALHQAAEWRRNGVDLDLSFNVSAADLEGGTLVTNLRAALERTDTHPERVTIEITDAAAMLDQSVAHDTLTALSALGVRLSLDGFGTGHADLGQVSRLPLQELKIDRSLLNGGPSEPQMAVVNAVIALGHALHHTVVVEGVEDLETLDRLAAAGCDHAQGIAISPQLPPHKLYAWVTLRRTTS